MPKTIIVNENDQGRRLDLFLNFSFNDYTRSIIKKQIELGNVFVNGNVEFKPNYRVKTDDQIECKFQIPNTVVKTIIPEDINLEVLYEDKHLIVINKPIGMVVHPATSNWSGTLLNALHYRYKDLESTGDKIRSGLIHRLDKDTSGLVLVSKTNEGLWYYSKLFSKRKIEKIYLAVVKGNFFYKTGNTELEINNYIGRNSGNRKKFTKVPPSKGKQAITKVEFMQLLLLNGKEYSLLRIVPKTGRTHQIRVHLSGIGMPILGDTVYGRGNSYQRLMLHAWKLHLKLLSGEEKSFEAVPDELFFNLTNHAGKENGQFQKLAKKKS